MPLTRHLYESDEVVAALQLSLRTGDKTAALFWTHELVVSDEQPIALQTLRSTWLRWGAPNDYTILTQDFSPSLVYRVARAIEQTIASALVAPINLLNAAAAAAAPPPTPVIAFTKLQQEARHLRATGFAKIATESGETDMPTAYAWWLSLEYAVRTQAPAAAMWYLQWAQPVLCADTIWSAITAITAAPHRSMAATIRIAASAHPTCQLLHQAAVILIITYRKETGTDVTPMVAEAQWATWAPTIGRRAGRILAIPVEALHASTTRGTLPATYTNIDDCRNPLTLLPVACRFWRNAITLAGMSVTADREDVIFPDDDILEQFYATYFPDDTPDEWSTTDQQKSHGRGHADTAQQDPATVFVSDTYMEPGFKDTVDATVTEELHKMRL
jgi:hypothetical protein